MENKSSLGVSVIGIGKVIIFILQGTAFLAFGAYMAVGDGLCIMYGGGGNLTVVPLICGLILASMGQSSFKEFIKAVFEFRRKKIQAGSPGFTSKERIFFILYIISAGVAIYQYIFWKSGIPK